MDESKQYSLRQVFFTDDRACSKAGVIARLHHHEPKAGALLTARAVAAAARLAKQNAPMTVTDREHEHSAAIYWN